MKKLIFIFLSFFILMCSEPIFAQSSTPVRELVTFDSSATVSAAIKLERGTQLGALYLPQSKGDTIRFVVSYDGVTYYDLQDPDNGADYVCYSDSSKASAFAVKPILIYPFTWIKVEKNVASTGQDTLFMYTIEYLK